MLCDSCLIKNMIVDNFHDLHRWYFLMVLSIWCQRRQFLPASRIESPSLTRQVSTGCGGDALRLQLIVGPILASIFQHVCEQLKSTKSMIAVPFR